ncbi:group II intron reverse transcriptase/maturase [Pyxidicoccus parkwayensis]|uniref:Group II intron reverse transcriptase/maturase n=1 Tax=Pyxidicoccus parkwayensis TaxID=2813578 RepID=A0ABX7NZ62_9BACT|nr:group II intron reverse transcriptase/maturase [Pyxidicoccus parkwaysis]QSQ24227.1 group II intron reverse transcriptase/maturase [Pyxidicoccus parkwaysis]
MLRKEWTQREIGVSLSTPTKLEELRARLYAKAKAEPAFRFYALYDKIHRRDVLTEALRQSKQKKGAAGVDGQTFEQSDAHGEERWLEELQRELQSKTYRPQPVRRVLIPKPGGGERPLGIPTLKERVVQTAAKLILEPIFEADLSEAAYGYRPGRSAVDAVKEVHQELKQGRTQVVDAALSKYFDTIPHAELMKSVARRVADKAVLHLVKMWLKVPIEERDEQGRPRYSGGERSKQEGISPLLANIYINRLLKVFAKSELMKRSGAKLVNYADDFVVVARRGAAEVLAQVKRWLDGMKLTLNETKTSLRDARKEHFRFLGYELGPRVYKRTGQKYLGARPSKKAMEQARGEVSRILRRGRTERWEQIAGELNRFLRGWATYFAYDSPTHAFNVLDWHVTERVRNFLSRRHKVARATSRFKYNEVHRTLGVLEVRALLR